MPPWPLANPSLKESPMLIFYVLAATAATALSIVLGIFRAVQEREPSRAGRRGPIVLLCLALVACGGNAAVSAGTGGGGGAPACPSLPNAKPSAGYPCLLECIVPFADCDGNPANGCETNTDSVDNCGACGVKCDPSQTCAIGCNETFSCFPSATNCPRCEPDPSADAACASANESFPQANACQEGAPATGGCIPSPFGPLYECCPAGPDGGK